MRRVPTLAQPFPWHFLASGAAWRGFMLALVDARKGERSFSEIVGKRPQDRLADISAAQRPRHATVPVPGPKSSTVRALEIAPPALNKRSRTPPAKFDARIRLQRCLFHRLHLLTRGKRSARAAPHKPSDEESVSQPQDQGSASRAARRACGDRDRLRLRPLPPLSGT